MEAHEWKRVREMEQEMVEEWKSVVGEKKIRVEKNKKSGSESRRGMEK